MVLKSSVHCRHGVLVAKGLTGFWRSTATYGPISPLGCHGENAWPAPWAGIPAPPCPAVDKHLRSAMPFESQTTTDRCTNQDCSRALQGVSEVPGFLRRVQQAAFMVGRVLQSINHN